uniref:Uncharacterized protein n=1 Tax=Mycena chlorophos TaxID=658473 RepID=A0ABQ0LFD1_MYCCL|nr:predicted protein [Mycena chlorophos]
MRSGLQQRTPPPHPLSPEKDDRRYALGSVQLKGVFLENARAAKSNDDNELEARMDSVDEAGSSSSSDNEGEEEPIPAPKPFASSQKPSADKPQTKLVFSPNPISAPATLQRQQAPEQQSKYAVDLVGEKNDTLRLLDSLFGGSDAKEWGGPESVGPDANEEELRRDDDGDDEDENGIEFVPMDADVAGAGQDEGEDDDDDDDDDEERPAAPIATSAEPSTTTKIKDLFVPHAEDTAGAPRLLHYALRTLVTASSTGASFSLLEHLDLELDDDTEFAHLSAVAEPAHTATQAAQVFVPAAAATTTRAAAVPITLGPKQSLFFPLASSFGSSTNNTTNNTETDEEISLRGIGRGDGRSRGRCSGEGEMGVGRAAVGIRRTRLFVLRMRLAQLQVFNAELPTDPQTILAHIVPRADL